MQRRTLLTTALAAPAIAAARPARAQALPPGPVRMLLPQAPGSANDIVARTIQEPLAAAIGRPVVIENRPGANGVVAFNALKAARNDGSTVMLNGVSQMAFNPHLYRALPYDVARDFTMIAPVTDAPFVLIAAPRLNVSTLPELVAAARAGDLSYSSAGIGNSTHLGMEMLLERAGMRMTHVPYGGTAQAVTAVMTGEVAAMVTTVASTLQQARAGAVRPIALVAEDRLSQLPDVPTQKEAGLDAPVMPGWFALVGLAGMAPPVVETLNAGIRAALSDPGVRTRLGDQLLIPLLGSAAEMQARLDRESALWGAFVRARGLTLG